MENGAIEICEDEAHETTPAPKRDLFWTVAINLCDRAYGGLEEGGWYYDVGEPCQSGRLARWTKVFTDEDEADKYAVRLNQTLCKRLNKGRRPVDSVLSEGEYGAIVHVGYPAEWPAKRPHYE
jgi:hypothetical protein